MNLNIESREDIMLQQILRPILHPRLHPILHPIPHPILHHPVLQHPILLNLFHAHQSQRAVHQIDGAPVDTVGREGVNMDPILGTHHLARTHGVEDAHLLGREVRMEFAGIVRAAGALEVFDPFEDRVALGGVHGHEGLDAKVDGVGDFFLCELAVNVGSTLNNCCNFVSNNRTGLLKGGGEGVLLGSKKKNEITH